MSFALNIAITPQSLDVMKGYLTRAMPDVKSSHRCEALGRGLGYQTYAAILHATDGIAPISVVQGDKFAAYLEAHGFKVTQDTLYRAAALAALHDVRDREPRLKAWGIGVGEYRQRPDGKWETYREREARFNEERTELISDKATIPFLLSLALLHRIPATATIRSGTGSYKLKHIAENYACTYPGGEDLGPVYVPNGMLVAAAIHAGYLYKTFRQESGFEGVNVKFNMSKRAIDDLDCEIRPNGATAQGRQRRLEMRRFKPLFQFTGVPGIERKQLRPTRGSGAGS